MQETPLLYIIRSSKNEALAEFYLITEQFILINFFDGSEFG